MAGKKAGKKEAVKGSNSLLNFFRKADQSAVDDPAQETKPKPRRKSSAKLASIRVEGGSAADPVLISDDDEPIAVSPPRHEIETERSAEEVEAGPSSPRRSCPRSGLPSPFPGMPEFVPPPSWPEIINVGSGDEDEDEILNDDLDGDGSVRVAESEDEEVEKTPDVVQIDGQDPPPPSDPVPVEIEPPDQIIRHTEPAVVSISPNTSTTHEDLIPDLVWDEPDEGMGMEDGDDENDSVIIATPPPVSLKRKRGAQDKVEECPVCQRSFKGLVNTMISQHINSCLDGSASTPQKVARPITSITHTFSPAPSSPSPPPEEVAKGPNAFSVLMSGHKEKEQWKDVEVDLKRDGKRTFGRRKAPFYKVMTGMPVAVDAFRYGAIPKVTAYLLTHAHSDHYTNLSRSWKEGPIYCSITTANLIIHMLGVEPKWVHGLPDNVPFEMPNTGGVTVTPIEANHCPGSSLFLFEGPQTVNAGDSPIKSPYVGSKRIFRYLHCGDFRASPKHVLHPAVARARIDTCYLDTTYLNPKYCFPPQPQVIEACATLARKTAVGISDTAPALPDIKPEAKVDTRFDAQPDINAVKQENEEKSKAMMQGWLVKRESGEDVKMEYDGMVKAEPGDPLAELGDVKPDLKPGLKVDVKPEAKARPVSRTLVVMGTYSIGKERIVKAVAQALGSKIYCDPRKKGILLCQTDPELLSLLSSDPLECQVHLLPLGQIQLDMLQPYLARLHPHFDRVLGFRPTGWSYSPPAGTDMLPDVNMVIKRDQARTFSDASLKPMRGSCRQFMMYGVPYSEHSSFFELTCFALSMPGPDVKMIATVNVGNENSRAKMKKWFEKWAAEKARRREKGLPAVVDYRDANFW